MSAENLSFTERNSNMLIIGVAVVVVLIFFLYFRGRQQDREIEIRRIDRQVELLEDWPPPRNLQPASSPDKPGKIL